MLLSPCRHGEGCQPPDLSPWQGDVVGGGNLGSPFHRGTQCWSRRRRRAVGPHCWCPSPAVRWAPRSFSMGMQLGVSAGPPPPSATPFSTAHHRDGDTPRTPPPACPHPIPAYLHCPMSTPTHPNLTPRHCTAHGHSTRGNSASYFGEEWIWVWEAEFPGASLHAASLPGPTAPAPAGSSW